MNEERGSRNWGNPTVTNYSDSLGKSRVSLQALTLLALSPHFAPPRLSASAVK